MGMSGSCWQAEPHRPDPIRTDAPGVALDALDLAIVELPADARDGKSPPESMLLGPWTRIESEGATRWVTPLPVRPRATFTGRAPRGLSVLDAHGRGLPYATVGLRRWWSVSERELTVALPDPAESPEGFRLRAPLAQSREGRLNPAFSTTGSPEEFVRARLQVDEVVREGLLLPAPAHLAVDVTIPPAGELHTTPLLIPPELGDLGPGDGAEVSLAVEVGGDGERELWRARLTPGSTAAPVHVDLSAFAGQSVRLHLRTDPGATSTSDYVLLADPIVAPRKVAPRRVLLVYIDTLRADHLGAYGYGRDTTPWVDAVGARGAVHEQAWSVAPWTLPAYRSSISGRRPTGWTHGPTLGERLREHGVATGALAANLYLSDAFGGARGFGMHRVEHLAPADAQVDRAIAWLDQHGDRDALLLLHFMDPHLPYEEPEPFRSKFAGPAPLSWRAGDRFLREAVRAPSAASKGWIVDRYDNNIAFVDAQLARLQPHLRDDDLVVIYSDHGEEFWDHGGFEHGHSLHQELVQVPLVIAGPGVTPGRLDAPVSLLDITPTVLDWYGLDVPADLDGRSLLTVRPTNEPEPSRALPLGHPLYGFERWGVVEGPHTFETTKGIERLTDRSGTQESIGPVPPDRRPFWHDQLAEAHGRELAEVTWIGVRTNRARAFEVDVALPVHPRREVVRAWLGEDATSPREPTLEHADDGSVTVTFPNGWRGARDVYLQLAEPTEAPRPMVLSVHSKSLPRPVVVPVPDETPGADSRLVMPFSDRAELTVRTAIVPVPRADDSATYGYDAELRGLLEQAGYLRDAGDGRSGSGDGPDDDG